MASLHRSLLRSSLRVLLIAAGLILTSQLTCFVSAGIFGRGYQFRPRKSERLVLHATDVIEVPKEKVFLSDLKQRLSEGSNCLKMLVDCRYIPGDGRQLQIDSSLILVAPGGQYFPFGEIGLKAMAVSGEQADIVASIRRYLSHPELRDRNASLRIIIPFEALETFRTPGPELASVQAQLSNFFLEEFAAGMEGVLALRGNLEDVVSALTLVVKTLNNDTFRDITRKHLHLLYHDGRRDLGQDVEIIVPMSEDESRKIVGKKGDVLTQIQKRFRIRVDTTRQAAADGRFYTSLKGRLGDVHEAHVEIQRLLKKWSRGSSGPQDE